MTRSTASATKSPDPGHVGELPPMTLVPEALRIVLEEAERVCALRSTWPSMASSSSPPWEETVNVEDSLVGRILARPVRSSERGYPPVPVSIVDGYAVRSQDCRASDLGVVFRVESTVYAGGSEQKLVVENSQTSSSSQIKSEEAVACQVATGAVVPDRFDAVVPVEQTQTENEGDRLDSEGSFFRFRLDSLPPLKGGDGVVPPGQWIRVAGSDIPPSTEVLAKGVVVTPVEIGVLAQLGITQVTVRRRPTVAVLSTGDEIVGPNQSHVIPDANRPILRTLVKTWCGYAVEDLGAVPDDADAVRTALLRAQADVVVTSGGVSVGDRDFLPGVLAELGATMLFGRLFMKPGKPTKFYRWTRQLDREKPIQTTLLLCLPGNPVSATVCSHLLLRPLLHALHRGSSVVSEHQQEQDHLVHTERRVVLAHDYPLDEERPEYHRVTLKEMSDTNNDGEQSSSLVPYAVSTGRQRSSRLLSMQGAEGLLVLPQGTKERPVCRKGETGLVLMLDNPLVVPFSRSLHLGTVGTTRRPRHSPAKNTITVRFFVYRNCPDDVSDGDDMTSCLQTAVPHFRWIHGGGCHSLDEALTLSLSSSSLKDNDGDVDVVWVIYRAFRTTQGGSMRCGADLTDELRKLCPGRRGDAIALKWRSEAALSDPLAALLEVAVGQLSLGQGRGSGPLVAVASDRGLQAGVKGVADLLERACRTP